MKPIEKVIAIICIIWGLHSIFVEKSIPFEAIITFISLFSLSQAYSKNEYNKIKIKGKVSNNYYLSFKPIFYGIVLIIAVLLIKWNWTHIIHLVGKDKIFKDDKSKFDILILPFNQICKSEGKNYDAGFVIKDRLENISNDFNLNINAHYLNNIKTNDITYNNAKDLRLYHNADIIIYGNLMTSDCSPSGDQICLHFQLDESYKFDQKSNNNYVNANVDDLKNGQIQEEIESIIFILTTISQIGFSDDIKMSEFLQSQLNEVDISSEISIYIDLADMLLAHNYQSAALKLYSKAHEIIIIKNGITDRSQFTIKINVNEDSYVIDKINFILEHQGFSNFGIGNAETNINYLENELKKNPKDTISLIELAREYINLGELLYQSGEFCASQTSYEKATHYTKNEISGNKYGYYSSQFGIAKTLLQIKNMINVGMFY
ncbi:MAG: hypothetical protein IPJ51_15090 [Saprospiraceae bacterium]|nr:hypothetical protein [Saprospiraceae bacterium]